ncbi:MAG: UDP-2,3-diacylglucosamine diphosphatase LpxI [Thermodesulfobacteriota bacterium]
MTNEAIGIIAGGGQFPYLFAEAARREGRRVVIIAHEGETAPELVEVADALYWVKLGQLGKILKYFKKEQVAETVFLGTITKTRIFRDVMPDLKGLSLWNRIRVKQDDAILRAFADELEHQGIAVRESTLYLKELLFPQGVLGRQRPSQDQVDDIRFGWKIAREIGRLDIGQSVVVRNGTVLAVEAIEGTDAAIRRGGQLGREKTVVVKLRKPGQDFRFDLPAIGITTIDSMREVKAAVLAVEAGHALLFDRENTIRHADRAGIAVVGIAEQPDGSLRF